MFSLLTYSTLQAYWWIVVSLLASILVFLMFVQGGQSLLYFLARNEMERKLMLNSTGRKWELTFTTLVTFGGAFFASFPLFYSTSFGGAYWVWMLILFSFVIQAVSYEYRTKINNFLGTKTFDLFLVINGVLGTILIGTAVGTFFTGSEFEINKMNITNVANPVISQWKTSTHGLEAALNIFNVLLGLSVFFLSRVLGLLYFINNIDNVDLVQRSAKRIKLESILFLVFFLIFLAMLFTMDGFAVNPENATINIESYKYLHNLLSMPLVFGILLIGVVAVLAGIYLGAFSMSYKGIWFAGIGTIATVFGIFMLAGFNNTAYYPSTYNLNSSLTIYNSSSSEYTLTAMSWVSLIVPFVIKT